MLLNPQSAWLGLFLGAQSVYKKTKKGTILITLAHKSDHNSELLASKNKITADPYYEHGGRGEPQKKHIWGTLPLISTVCPRSIVTHFIY